LQGDTNSELGRIRREKGGKLRTIQLRMLVSQSKSETGTSEVKEELLYYTMTFNKLPSVFINLTVRVENTETAIFILM
jgi:hypothetical protein